MRIRSRVLPVSLPSWLCLPLAAQAYTFEPAPDRPAQGGMCWDPLHNRVVVLEQPFSTGRMWAWDGAARTFRPIVGPRHDYRGRPVFDPVRGEIHCAAVYSVATFDGARWRTASMPTTWVVGAMAFDGARGRLVVLVRVGPDERVAEWDGAQWALLPSTNAPATGGPFVFDPGRGVCVLASGDPVTLHAWDGLAWTTIAGSGPTSPALPATQCELAHDAIANRLVLHGAAIGAAMQTFAFDAAGWQSIATPAFAAIHGASLSWDGVGVLRIDPLDGVWRLEGQAWRRVAAEEPAPRSDAALASNPLQPGILMFGGGGSLALDDTWTLRSGAWRRETPANVPPARIQAGLAWSVADNALVLFGGRIPGGAHFNDTWLWNGSDWIAGNAAMPPPPRARAVLVQEPGGGVLLVGGQDATTLFDDCWRFRNGAWTSLGLAPPRVGAGQPYGAYDAVRQRSIVLLGSNAQAWDGTAWTQAGILSAPPLGAVFDPVRQRVFAFTYDTFSPAMSFDGTTWQSETLSGESLRMPLQLAADAGGRRAWSLFHSYDTNFTTSVLTPTPARAEPFGYGCALGAAPGLTCRGRPVPATPTFAIDLAAFATNAPAAVAIGFAQQPLHLGAGCVSWLGTSGVAQFVLADATGQATLPLPLPANAALRGLTVMMQAAVVDPARSPGGVLTVSEGLRIAIGD